jgi:hypothetical protein
MCSTYQMLVMNTKNSPVHGSEKALDFKHILENISPISEVILLLVSVHSNLVLT